MPRLRMTKVEDPSRSPYDTFTGTAAPFLVGDGNTDYTCAECNTLLLQRVRPIRYRQAVFQCPICGTSSTVVGAR